MDRNSSRLCKAAKTLSATNADLGSSRLCRLSVAILAQSLKMSKRTAVDVSPDALLLALNLLPFRNDWVEVWLVCEQEVQASSFLGEGIEGCAVLELHRRRQHGQSGQA